MINEKVEESQQTGEMYHWIYIWWNLINGKGYAGQTDDLVVRKRSYKSNVNCRRFEQVIVRALAKYGMENFRFEVVATCRSQEDANDLEEMVIAQYDFTNREKGYNIRKGGVNSSLPDEVKRKISISSMGKPGTNTGKTFDKEWVLKISKSQAGKDKITKRRFSEEVEKEICKLYVEGMSFYKLAQKYECYRSLIITIIDRNNIPHRKNQYTGHNNGKNIFSKEKELEICKLYEEGQITRKALAIKFNCGNTTIREILLRNNIKL